jgi:hypothetical protein
VWEDPADFAPAEEAAEPAPGGLLVSEETAGEVVSASPGTDEVTDPTEYPEAVYGPTGGELNPTVLHEVLDPDGTWIDIDGCWWWQPRLAVVDPQWRPYVDGGCWVYTELGWFWWSEYPWGWIAFHYGRWMCHPEYGWLWCLGEEWAPAWVEWRASEEYYGWAPLPPEAASDGTMEPWADDLAYVLTEADYCFVRRECLLERKLKRFCFPRSSSAAIHRHTEVVKNLLTTANGKVRHGGPDPDHVAKACLRPLRSLQVKEKAEPRVVPSDYVQNDSREKQALVAGEIHRRVSGSEERRQDELQRRDERSQRRSQELVQERERKHAPLEVLKERERQERAVWRETEEVLRRQAQKLQGDARGEIEHRPREDRRGAEKGQEEPGRRIVEEVRREAERRQQEARRDEARREAEGRHEDSQRRAEEQGRMEREHQEREARRQAEQEARRETERRHEEARRESERRDEAARRESEQRQREHHGGRHH